LFLNKLAVLLPGITEDGLKKIRLQIKRCVKNYNYAHKSFPLSLSLGSSIRTSCSLSVTDLFKEANDNMYKEKLYSNQSTRNAIVNTLMKALGERDHMTEGHGCRLQSLVIAMAQQLKICERRYTDLKLFSQFHDIGKVGVPDSILLKPGPLAPDEAREMMTHCNKGYQIALSAKELTPIADWILKHHEWWNGEGYPLGLKGREIPLECRMLAIADAYDAMINDRPYRKAMMHEKAIKLIIRSSGTQFDPELVPIFISVVDKIKNKRS
jgi:HD-GYP domain-containing protein (c-di-GMP phosphodiesterase class II)